MRSLVTVAALAVVVLAGCAPQPPGDSRNPPASATSKPSGLVLPTCDTLLTDEQVDDLMGASMQSSGTITGGYGVTDPGLQHLIHDADEALNCSWILPSTERAVNVSMVRADAATRTTITGLLAPLTGTPNGSAVYFDSATTGDFPFTEAHAVGAGGADLWISVVDGSGTRALDIATAAWDSVASLNPGL